MGEKRFNAAASQYIAEVVGSHFAHAPNSGEAADADDSSLEHQQSLGCAAIICFRRNTDSPDADRIDSRQTIVIRFTFLKPRLSS